MEVNYSGPVKALMAMTDEVVPARVLAPIVKMHPSKIISLARSGEWDRCEVVFSGKRVKFLRIDFLRKGGWIQ